MPGSDDELTLDEFFLDAELGEITKPEHRHAPAANLARGSEILAAPPAERARAPLDGIDAVLVAYLMDLAVSPPPADHCPGTPDGTGPSVDGAVDKLEAGE